MPLNVPTEPGHDEIAGDRQGPVLDRKAVTDGDFDHAVKEVKTVWEGRRFTEHL